MRLRTYVEATAFIKTMLKAKQDGKRAIPGLASLDSVPAWSGVPKDPSAPAWVPDGSEVDAVYLSYLPATDKQKEEAKPAKLAGVKLERITGRLVDVRTCLDGTVQVLFTSGLRDAEDKPAFRGPNVDKGILCALSIGEGLGESVDEIIARVPQEMIDKLKAGKEKTKKKSKAETKVDPGVTVKEELIAAVKINRGPTMIDVPSIEPKSDEVRLKLK
jgi:hypothetical protein